jgi:hypothetical protein
MKKLLTMLITMTIVIGMTAQNNGFNFNKTNDYRESNICISKEVAQKHFDLIDEICELLNLTEEECFIFTKEPAKEDWERFLCEYLNLTEEECEFTDTEICELLNLTEEDCILFSKEGIINLAAQNNGFNFNKTNNYSK